MSDESDLRDKIVATALAETTQGVEASKPDPLDPTKRKGWLRLQEYFRVAPDFSIPAEIKFPLPPKPTDWCGIFALWATKTAGVSWVGTWKRNQGISSVDGFFPTANPMPGDVAAVAEGSQHMDIVHEVSGNLISTIDGNDTGGTVTSSSLSKSKSSFTAGFFTAFPRPLVVGTWLVRVGVYTWFYKFNNDGTATWTDIKQPPEISGEGKWGYKAGGFLEISWEEWTDQDNVTHDGSTEHWDLPLKRQGQTGTLVGQGRIINATKLRDF